MSARSVLFALAVVALVAAATAGCQKPAEPTPVAPAARPPATPAAKTPAAEPAGAGPDVKAITLELLDGTKVALADHLDKDVVVIDFWATWCGPCKQYMPDFVRLSETYKDKGAVFYAVSTDEKGAAVVKPFVEQNKVTCNVALDPKGDVANVFGVTGIPHTFVIDKSGKVAAEHKGYSPQGAEEVAKAVDAALAG